MLDSSSTSDQPFACRLYFYKIRTRVVVFFFISSQYIQSSNSCLMYQFLSIEYSVEEFTQDCMQQLASLSDLSGLFHTFIIAFSVIEGVERMAAL